MIDNTLPSEDLAQVLTDMRFGERSTHHSGYGTVEVSATIDGITHNLEVNEYSYDPEANVITIITVPHVT